MGLIGYLHGFLGHHFLHAPYSPLLSWAPLTARDRLRSVGRLLAQLSLRRTQTLVYGVAGLPEQPVEPSKFGKIVGRCFCTAAMAEAWMNVSSVPAAGHCL